MLNDTFSDELPLIFQKIFNIFASTVAFKNGNGNMLAYLHEHTSPTQSEWTKRNVMKWKSGSQKYNILLALNRWGQLTNINSMIINLPGTVYLAVCRQSRSVVSTRTSYVQPSMTEHSWCSSSIIGSRGNRMSVVFYKKGLKKIIWYTWISAWGFWHHLPMIIRIKYMVFYFDNIHLSLDSGAHQAYDLKWQPK